MSMQQVSMQVKHLFEQAKSLSEDERILLADLLYAASSLSPGEWEAAWIKECERRLAEYALGKAQAINSNEVFARLKSKYNLK